MKKLYVALAACILASSLAVGVLARDPVRPPSASCINQCRATADQRHEQCIRTYGTEGTYICSEKRKKFLID